LRELPELNTAALELPGHGATPGPSHDLLASYARWVRPAGQCWPDTPWAGPSPWNWD
jgi:hypothetical protein